MIRTGASKVNRIQRVTSVASLFSCRASRLGWIDDLYPITTANTRRGPNLEQGRIWCGIPNDTSALSAQIDSYLIKPAQLQAKAKIKLRERKSRRPGSGGNQCKLLSFSLLSLAMGTLPNQLKKQWMKTRDP